MADSVRAARPPGWGEDPVTGFIEAAQQNAFALYANVPNFFERVTKIDVIFRKAVQYFGRPDDWLPGLFLLRVHSGFLGGTRLSVSGQIPEAYMVLRGCLEASLYGFYIAKDPSRATIWLNRGDSEEARRASRREFTTAKPMGVLQETNERLHSIVGDLYELCIDQGGHPNVDAFMANLKMNPGDEGIRLELAYLSGPSPALELCLKSVLRIGVASLRVFEQMVPERFKILGISEELEGAQEGL